MKRYLIHKIELKSFLKLFLFTGILENVGFIFVSPLYFYSKNTLNYVVGINNIETTIKMQENFSIMGFFQEIISSFFILSFANLLYIIPIVFLLYKPYCWILERLRFKIYGELVDLVNGKLEIRVSKNSLYFLIVIGIVFLQVSGILFRFVLGFKSLDYFLAFEECIFYIKSTGIILLSFSVGYLILLIIQKKVKRIHLYFEGEEITEFNQIHKENVYEERDIYELEIRQIDFKSLISSTFWTGLIFGLGLSIVFLLVSLIGNTEYTLKWHNVTYEIIGRYNWILYPMILIISLTISMLLSQLIFWKPLNLFLMKKKGIKLYGSFKRIDKTTFEIEQLDFKSYTKVSMLLSLFPSVIWTVTQNNIKGQSMVISLIVVYVLYLLFAIIMYKWFNMFLTWIRPIKINGEIDYKGIAFDVSEEVNRFEKELI